MKYIIPIIIGFFLVSNCFADITIRTARHQDLQVKDGDTLKNNSFWVGTIEDLNDVTFIRWNFSRPTPHTEVFKNCRNLTFIDCNLNNVELQSDFTVKGCLVIHQRTYELAGKTYKEIECGDNKTRTYEIIEEDVDIVERDFKDFKKEDKDIIKLMYEEQGIDLIQHTEEQNLVSTTETPDEKKIKAIYIHPNTGLPR